MATRPWASSGAGGAKANYNKNTKQTKTKTNQKDSIPPLAPQRQTPHYKMLLQYCVFSTTCLVVRRCRQPARPPFTIAASGWQSSRFATRPREARVRIQRPWSDRQPLLGLKDGGYFVPVLAGGASPTLQGWQLRKIGDAVGDGVHPRPRRVFRL